VFNTAFLDHPTPITVTRELVEWADDRDFEGLSKNLLLRAAGNEGEPTRLIGFARTRLIPSETETSGEIDFVALLQEWRGRGLGKSLLAWAVAELRERGAGPINLRVEAQNAAALELYLRTGFAPTREWRRFGRPA